MVIALHAVAGLQGAAESGVRRVVSGGMSTFIIAPNRANRKGMDMFAMLILYIPRKIR